MTTWDNILSHYSFDSKLYDELYDPADLRKPFVDVVPSYPIPAFRPNYNRFDDYEYDNILSPILPSIETLFDFPVSVDVTYLDETSSWRQGICYSKYHNFLSLYNHSDFVKMHMHNAWLLGKTDLTISICSDFFVQPKYLFVFCGSLKLSQIYNNCDANTFDYHSFLFATSYLMINDSFLLQLLKSSGTVTFRLNNTILPTLYTLLNLDFALPQTLNWFESKFKFITIILFLVFVIYRTKLSDRGFSILKVTISDTKTISSPIFLAAHIVPTLVIFASNTTVHTILVLITNSHILRTSHTNLTILNFAHLVIATNRMAIGFG